MNPSADQSYTRFIETAQATVVWRPIRLAYLIRLNDRDGLRDAISYASTELGGVSHPMLPIDGRGRVPPLDLQIAQMLKPDLLVNYAGADYATVQRVAALVDADPVFDRHVQFGLHPLAPESADALRSRTVLVPANPRDLRQVVALGQIPAEQEADWAGLAGRIQPAARPLDLLDGQLEVPSPLGVTWPGAATIQHSAWFGRPIIVDCWPVTFRRAIWVWNLRATAVQGWGGVPTRLVWLPERALDDSDVRARIKEASLPSRTLPDLILNGPDPSHLHDVARSLGFSEMTGTETSAQLEFPARERDLAERPLTYRVNGHPAQWLFGDRRYGTPTPVAVPVTKPRMLFRVDAPIRCRAGTGGYLRVSVEGIEDLRWPQRRSVARLIEQNATYRDGALGFVVGTAPSFTFNLAVPEAEAVVSAIIGERGWRWSTSDKGRYAQGLAEAAGQHAMTLASAETLRFAEALATLSRRKAEQILRRLQGRDTDTERLLVAERLSAGDVRWRTLGEVAGDLRVGKKTLLPVANRLLEAGLLRRAFRMRCRSCGLPWHLELSRADDVVACPGCFARQPLIGPASQEPELAYALNSLFDRAIDQDCVSHLLADLVVRQLHGAVWSVPGAVVTADGGREREVDLLALSRDTLIVGELKAHTAQFRRSYVRDLAALARDLNANTLLLAGLDTWSEEHRAAVGSWVGPGLDVLALGSEVLLAQPATEPTSSG